MMPARDLRGLRARGALALGLGGCLVLAVGVFGWAARAVIIGAVVATGEIDATPARHSIQHPLGGPVAVLAVQDGQAVAAGDLLLRLESTAIDGELDLIDAQDREARARQIRLEAERDGTPFPPAAPDEPAAVAADGVRKAAPLPMKQFPRSLLAKAMKRTMHLPARLSAPARKATRMRFAWPPKP